MKDIFSKEELEQLPLNFILSIPKDGTALDFVPRLGENGDLKYDSSLHQNANKITFEGFYKSITRKI